MATHGYETGRLNLPCLTPDTEKRQYVFTEWDPTATSDMEALASYFDSNGDGVLDASDAALRLNAISAGGQPSNINAHL